MDEFETTINQAEDTIARTAVILRDLEASGAQLNGLTQRTEAELRRFSDLAKKDGLNTGTTLDLLGLSAEMVSEWFATEVDLLEAYAEFGKGLEGGEGETSAPAKPKKSRPGGNRVQV